MKITERSFLTEEGLQSAETSFETTAYGFTDVSIKLNDNEDVIRLDFSYSNDEGDNMPKQVAMDGLETLVSMLQRLQGRLVESSDDRRVD